MTEEEHKLTPNPSDENPEAPTEEDTPDEDMTEDTSEEDKDKMEQLEQVAQEGQPEYETETVSSGPLSEEVKVFNLEDLQQAADETFSDQKKIYESSLKSIVEEQRIIGNVVSVNDDEILMDIGFKSEGVVSRAEFAEGELPKVGDQIEVFVDVLEDENGQMILSKKKADFMRVWERIRDIYDNRETIEGRILNRIKGGMVVDIMGIDAFLPGSQIDVRPVTDFDSYVGKTYDFRIVKLNELRKNVVLSRKELLEESLKEKREELLSRIKVGDVLKGRVKNITDFGVFIDLGGLDGLLHITDLSWGRVNHPREMVDIDEELTVKVIDYDPERQRVSLGLKQLTPHPWEGIEDKYPVGSVIKGKVVNIANYGVFVELEKGVEGLVHISEISWTQHIKHPSEVFSVGEMIESKILNIDTEERKISLGYKQLEPDPWESIEQTYVVGSVQKGQVRNITPYGAFIELQDGIDGFVHIRDLSWTRKIRHPREILKRGDEVDVKILGVSKENRKINLGMKQLEEDPWPQIEQVYVEGAIVEGEVAKITDKVIVVKLDYGLEGIVPIGQLPKDERKSADKKFGIGDRMQLKILEFNKDDKRLVLSREQAITREPASKKYVPKKGETTDKLEIPDEVREKIAEAEKTRVTKKTKTKEEPKEEKAVEEAAAEKKKPAKKSAKAAGKTRKKAAPKKAAKKKKAESVMEKEKKEPEPKKKAAAGKSSTKKKSAPKAEKSAEAAKVKKEQAKTSEKKPKKAAKKSAKSTPEASDKQSAKAAKSTNKKDK